MREKLKREILPLLSNHNKDKDLLQFKANNNNNADNADKNNNNNQQQIQPIKNLSRGIMDNPDRINTSDPIPH